MAKHENSFETTMPLENTDNSENAIYDLKAYAILPNGDGNFAPCPELLTEDEAIRYLRLDVNGPMNPGGTLKYYRDQGVLRAIRIGRNLRYPRKELDRMIERLLSKRKV
jgi:hypothetical protein